ncbi:hypothetical protein [Actinoplanes regularis]|uniref:hypothetical protein n=1 Tax=Actinoplanes regularis TaxID=52697 RepID=UPI0024A089D9|nr:hypothetical protein [Actinoplanes regularis]GLW32294.1 hypothetical protein Areg01_52330 [Actinoplanes regularis]
MSNWQKHHDRLQQEWSIRELRKQGRLHEIKGISPEMDRRIRNAERRIQRKSGKS